MAGQSVGDPGDRPAVPRWRVLERPGVTVLDTREMPWEESRIAPVLALVKNVSFDDDGDSIIQIRCLAAQEPSARSAAVAGFRLARELYFVLGGEFSHWEIDPAEGDLEIDFGLFDWMDRLAGNVTSGATSLAIGVTALGWMTTTDDPFVGLRESATLATPLPLARRMPTSPRPSAGAPPQDGSRRGVVLDRPLVRVVRTRDLAWEPHPTLPGARLKVLSRAGDGDPLVSIVWIPPGPYPVAELPSRVADDFREFAYVLEGDVSLVEFEGAGDEQGTRITLRQGFWLDRHPGRVHGYPDGSCSETGCTFLQFRTRTGAGFAKSDDKYRVWSRGMQRDEVGAGSTPADDERVRVAQRTLGQ
jgi:hypothetical protein